MLKMVAVRYERLDVDIIGKRLFFRKVRKNIGFHEKVRENLYFVAKYQEIFVKKSV